MIFAISPGPNDRRAEARGASVRKLFLQINVSLDGYIEDIQGEIDWHFADDEFEEFINETLRSIDAMVFGRVAYELLAQYWPMAATDPDAAASQLGRNPRLHREAARLMHELPKFVVSNTLEQVDWHNSHILRAATSPRRSGNSRSGPART
jgi:dihydrofolate reductase